MYYELHPAYSGQEEHACVATAFVLAPGVGVEWNVATYAVISHLVCTSCFSAVPVWSIV